MITGLIALGTAHLGSIVCGAAAAGVAEAIIPIATRAHRARRATNLVRRIHRRRHGRGVSKAELQQVRREEL